MSIEGMAGRPAFRMTMTDLRTLETLEVPRNPVTLETSFDTNWNETVVPGLSHPVLQFNAVGAAALPFEFELSEYMTEWSKLDDFDRFLQSLGYPEHDASSVLEGAPTRVLIVWPRVLSITCVLRSYQARYDQFAPDDGRAISWKCSIKATEIRDERIGASDIRRNGWRRPMGSALAALGRR